MIELTTKDTKNHEKNRRHEFHGLTLRLKAKKEKQKNLATPAIRIVGQGFSLPGQKAPRTRIGTEAKKRLRLTVEEKR